GLVLIFNFMPKRRKRTPPHSALLRNFRMPLSGGAGAQAERLAESSHWQKKFDSRTLFARGCGHVLQPMRMANRLSYFDRDGGSAHVYAFASIPTITSSNLGERHAVCSASASFTAVIFRTTLLPLSASMHFNA